MLAAPKCFIIYFVVLFSSILCEVLSLASYSNILRTRGGGSSTQTSLQNGLNITVVTWNLCEKSPSEEDYCVVFERHIGKDIIIVGIQELEDIRPRRNAGRRTVRMRQLQRKVFGRQYERIAQHQMGGLQIAVFAKRKIARLVDRSSVLEVACGVGNVMTNKGAVCAVLRIKGRKIILINAHLAAHQSKVSARNADFKRIMDSISLKLAGSDRSSASRIAFEGKPRAVLKRQAQNNADGVIFFGDLNYRVNLPRLEVEEFYDAYEQLLGPFGQGSTHHMLGPRSSPVRGSDDLADSLASLLEYDQLSKERAAGNAFSDFNEGRISFPPTFKYDVGSSRLDSSKKARCPAWTDRILFHSAADRNRRQEQQQRRQKKKNVSRGGRRDGGGECDGESSGAGGDRSNNKVVRGLRLRLQKYYSIEARSSDHRPVCAEFLLLLSE